MVNSRCHGFYSTHLGISNSNVWSRFPSSLSNSRSQHLFSDYTRESTLPDAEKIDIFSPGYGVKIVFYIFCGFLDSMWQTGVYWLIGAMSNDPAKLAHFTGFCWWYFLKYDGCTRWHALPLQTNPFNRPAGPVSGERMVLGFRECSDLRNEYTDVVVGILMFFFRHGHCWLPDLFLRSRWSIFG